MLLFCNYYFNSIILIRYKKNFPLFSLPFFLFKNNPSLKMRIICKIFRARLISVDLLFVNYVLGRSLGRFSVQFAWKTPCKRGFLISRARSSIGRIRFSRGKMRAIRIGRCPYAYRQTDTHIRASEPEYRPHLLNVPVCIANLQHTRLQWTRNAGHSCESDCKRNRVCKSCLFQRVN